MALNPKYRFKISPQKQFLNVCIHFQIHWRFQCSYQLRESFVISKDRVDQRIAGWKIMSVSQNSCWDFKILSDQQCYAVCIGARGYIELQKQFHEVTNTSRDPLISSDARAKALYRYKLQYKDLMPFFQAFFISWNQEFAQTLWEIANSCVSWRSLLFKAVEKRRGWEKTWILVFGSYY